MDCRIKFKLFIFIALPVFFVFEFKLSKAQTCCSGGNPLTGNLGIQEIEPNSWYFLLGYDYNFLDDLYAGKNLLNDNRRERITQSILLQAIYPVTQKFSVNALLTFVGQKRTIFSPLGTTNRTQTQGLGDVVILGQYTLFSNLKRSFTFGAGPKIPTGRFNATDPEFGLVLSPDLQPGSGSFDGIAGAAFSEYHWFNIPGFTFSASAGYRLTTPARRFEGDNKYRFGNEMMLSGGIQKNFLLKTRTLTPSVFVRYRNTSNDQIDKNRIEGTGGNWVYVNPGLSFEPNNNISFNISGEIPVYRNLNGTQLTTTFRLNAGVAIRIFNN